MITQKLGFSLRSVNYVYYTHIGIIKEEKIIPIKNPKLLVKK